MTPFPRIDMKKLLALALFLLAANSCLATTYYVDYAYGLNSNNGTTKSTPWKSHPYMQNAAGCGGALPSYTHVAGDQFIFKGGVTWPVACFQMSITVSGSSGSNVDYYGVDVTWFTGASFTRPKFDLSQNIPSGNHVININGQSSITIDNIEIVNQGISAQGGFGTGSAILCTSCGSSVMVTNAFIHDWITNGTFSNALGGPDYPMGSLDGNIILDHTEVSDANGFAFNSTGNKITVAFGGACRNCQEIRFSKMHDIMAGSFTVQSTHDTEFFNISQTLWDAAPPTGFGLTDAGPIFARPHTQVIEDDFGQLVGQKIYNNYIHDTNAGVTIAPEYPVFIYNNVLSNNSNSYIYIDDRNLVPAQLGQTGYIVNNTMDCSNGQLCINWIGTVSSGSLVIQNNIFITNGTAVPSFSGSGLAVTQSNNYTMPTSEASSKGFISANKYLPASSDSNTIAQGINFTSSCSGGLASLCSDTQGAAWFGGSYKVRPTGSTAWDLGAYVGFGAGTVATPTFSLAVGSYLGTQSVTISDSTGGAALFYCIDTTNSCAPTTTVSGAVSITTSEYLRAQGTLSGLANSAVASAIYLINLFGNPFQSNLDNFNANLVVYTPGTTPSGSGGFTATACLLFIATADNTKPWGCAIYSDSGTGQPKSLLCSIVSSSANPTVPAPVNGWNSVVPSGCPTLTNSTQYWIGQITGSNAQSQAKSLGLCPSGNGSFWSSTAQGSTVFPATAGPFIPQSVNCYSAYVTFSAVTPTAPAVTLTPTSLVFGDQSTGTTSGAQAVTLQNTGTANLHTTAVSVSGPFSNAGTGTCAAVPFDLAANASCTFNITFSPVVLNLSTGSLTLTDNAASSPQTVSLSGSGVPPPSPVTIPTFSPPATATPFTSAQTITISTTTSGASIVYTLDGSTPTVSADCTVTNGTLLSNGGTVVLSSTKTLSAIGCKAGIVASSIISGQYLIPTPVAAPQFVLNFLTVTITSPTQRATICYTTNGIAPTTDGAGTCLTGTTLQNGGSVVVTSGTTVKAIASKSGFLDSPLVTAIVILVTGTATTGQPIIIIFF